MNPTSNMRDQLEKMLEFTKMVTGWYGHIDNLSTPALLRLFRGGSMLAKVFGKRQKVTSDQEKAGEALYPETEMDARGSVLSGGPALKTSRRHPTRFHGADSVSARRSC